MAKEDDLIRRALERIAKCNDPLELRRTAENAKVAENGAVREAALRKLYAVRPDAKPGTLEHDVGRASSPGGSLLRSAQDYTSLANEPKIQRDGEQLTVADLVIKPASEGIACSWSGGCPNSPLRRLRFVIRIGLRAMSWTPPGAVARV